VDDCDTIIVGAGPAGLAVAASLRRKGVSFEILDRGDGVGASWRRHYDRLHLHTPKRHSALPFLPYPKTFPRYPSRDQVVEYLEVYARQFDLRPTFGADVTRCARTVDDAWQIDTNNSSHRARHLVVASGFNRVPRLPTWPGLDDFAGALLHSSDYANADPFRAQRVLVIGFGNSGAEIALDLSERGADCAVAVRGPVNVVPRDILGIPVTSFALATQRLPPRIADRLNALSIRVAIGDLARLGLVKRKDGPSEEILKSRQVPVVDVGTIAAIRGGRIRVRPAVESFSRDAIRFVDGRSETFDAVVLATGFETGLPAMFPNESVLFDRCGRPQVCGREAATGLYFCGFDLVPTGLIRQIGIESARIADRIAAG